jgi:hypothetical protein
MINNWHEHLVADSRSSVAKQWMARGELTELNKHALKALESGDALVITELDILTKSVRALKQEQFKKPMQQGWDGVKA